MSVAVPGSARNEAGAAVQEALTQIVDYCDSQNIRVMERTEGDLAMAFHKDGSCVFWSIDTRTPVTAKDVQQLRKTLSATLIRTKK